MRTQFFVKVATMAVVLTVISMVAEQPAINSLKYLDIFLIFLSNVLVVGLLGYYILKSNLARWKLIMSVFLIYFVIGYFNHLIEALIFNVTEADETIREIVAGLLYAAVFSPILVYLFGKWDASPFALSFKKRSIGSWIWRVLVADVLYVIIYLAAGMILQAVYPQMLSFYEGKLPPAELMIGTQFIRAAIFISLALLILRTTNLPKAKRAVLVGLFFSILAGIAPLMTPNPYMPEYVRIGHIVEVGVSNFIYGLLLGLLLGQKILVVQEGEE
jgi:hypothetical protein